MSSENFRLLRAAIEDLPDSPAKDAFMGLYKAALFYVDSAPFVASDFLIAILRISEDSNSWMYVSQAAAYLWRSWRFESDAEDTAPDGSESNA